MIQRTILLGMNNPDPNDAFSTKKITASGARLLSFMNEYLDDSYGGRLRIGGFDFERCFDRRNMLDEAYWSYNEAAQNRNKVLKSVRNRRVIVFGSQTINALGLRAHDVFDWIEKDGTYWCFCPHPSGLNRVYNVDTARKQMGEILWIEMQFGVGWLSMTQPPGHDLLTNIVKEPDKSKFSYPPT